MKNTKWYIAILLLVAMSMPVAGYADEPANGAEEPFNYQEAPVESGIGPTDPEDTPIDGGLTVLLAVGAAYGIKKYRDGRKENEQPEKAAFLSY